MLTIFFVRYKRFTDTKIHRDKTNAVIAVPNRSTQYCYPQLLQMTNQYPLYFRPSPRNMTLADKPLVNHPLCNYKYSNYIKQWTSYSKSISHIETSHVLDFLSGMFDKEHAYSTIDSTKCAIATIVHIPPYNSLNTHPLINKYMTE